MIIPCIGSTRKIFVTNGFHSSRVVKVKCTPGIHFYEVAGFIDNTQLLIGLVMVLIFFTVFIFTGSILFMIFANAPILIMLFLFYIKRKDFIQVHVLVPDRNIMVN
ncbi:MAG TPA: hypothetical protein VKH37_13030 [Ferruginibacter sp.]|nr:hypothetical protein [Ferruginibacter sp.]